MDLAVSVNPTTSTWRKAADVGTIVTRSFLGPIINREKEICKTALLHQNSEFVTSRLCTIHILYPYLAPIDVPTYQIPHLSAWIVESWYLDKVFKQFPRGHSLRNGSSCLWPSQDRKERSTFSIFLVSWDFLCAYDILDFHRILGILGTMAFSTVSLSTYSSISNWWWSLYSFDFNCWV